MYEVPKPLAKVLISPVSQSIRIFEKLEGNSNFSHVLFQDLLVKDKIRSQIYGKSYIFEI